MGGFEVYSLVLLGGMRNWGRSGLVGVGLVRIKCLHKGETRLVGKVRTGMWEALTGRWMRLDVFKSSKILIIPLCYFQGFA